MNKLIYISHPYGGERKNKNRVEQIIKTLVSLPGNQNKTFLSPIHAFGYLYNEVEYEKGLQMCLDLLQCCDEMWIFGDWTTSQGCRAEVEYCKKRNIKMVFGKMAVK